MPLLVTSASGVNGDGYGALLAFDRNGVPLGVFCNDPRTPPYERISLVFASGDNSYPLINYEYAVVSKSQPSIAMANALRHFLLWAISEAGGNNKNYLEPIGFIPLPDFIRGLSQAQIAEIKPTS